MADHIVIEDKDGNPVTVGADDVSSVHYQIVKLAFGALDTATLVASGAGLPVSVATVPSHDVTNAGTFAVQSSGTVAHDAVDSGNPIKSGAVAVAHGTNPTAVAAADRTHLYANRAGVPFTIGGHPNIQSVRLQFTGAQTNAAVITVSAGTKIVVTSLLLTLDNTSTAFPSVRIGFGTASTPTTSQVIAAHGGVPAGGGLARGDGSGILGVGADDEDLRITTSGAVTGNGFELIVTYFTIES